MDKQRHGGPKQECRSPRQVEAQVRGCGWGSSRTGGQMRQDLQVSALPSWGTGSPSGALSWVLCSYSVFEGPFSQGLVWKSRRTGQ